MPRLQNLCSLARPCSDTFRVAQEHIVDLWHCRLGPLYVMHAQLTAMLARQQVCQGQAPLLTSSAILSWHHTQMMCCCLQLFFQWKYFIPDPIKNDVQYQARAQPFLVFGLLTTGLAIGNSH